MILFFSIWRTCVRRSLVVVFDIVRCLYAFVRVYVNAYDVVVAAAAFDLQVWRFRLLNPCADFCNLTDSITRTTVNGFYHRFNLTNRINDSLLTAATLCVINVVFLCFILRGFILKACGHNHLKVTLCSVCVDF